MGKAITDLDWSAQLTSAALKGRVRPADSLWRHRAKMMNSAPLGRNDGLALLLLEVGLGIMAFACVVPVAFNFSMDMVSLTAMPAFALGAAACGLALPSLWRAAWRGGGLGARVLLASGIFVIALAAAPGRYVHAVAQDLWGLSAGTDIRARPAESAAANGHAGASQ